MFSFLGYFLTFLILGVPISLALGVGGLLFLYFTDNWMLVGALPGKMLQGVDQFICTDLIVHGWDLSRAAGLDEHIDPNDLAAVRQAMAPMADKMRSPQAFGPEIDAPAEADEQTKLLAFLGRRA